MRSSRVLLSGAKKLSVYRSTSVNPFVNLAVESFLFNNPKEPDEYALYLWRNGPSVIIGKFQSAWRECEVKKMEDEKVNLVRRPSGGGAVYQDLGNSIFTFLSPKSDKSSIETNNSILLDALSTFGVRAVATGRNDLHVDGRKISGAAFRNTKDRSLHHGTILLNLDMTALGRYLTPNKVKLQSKGVSSVEAHVLNLQTRVPSITHEGVCEALTQAFFRAHSDSCAIEDIDADTILKAEPHVRQVAAQLEDWDWRFGSKEPPFTHQIETSRLSWGTFDVNMVVRKGVVESATIYCDALDIPLLESIQAALTGTEYSADGVRKALESVVCGPTTNPDHLNEFTDWVVNKL
jgi:lipoate---protein ligase